MDAMDQQVLDLCSSLHTDDASALCDPFASPTLNAHYLGSPVVRTWSPNFGLCHHVEEERKLCVVSAAAPTTTTTNLTTSTAAFNSFYPLNARHISNGPVPNDNANTSAPGMGGNLKTSTHHHRGLVAVTVAQPRPNFSSCSVEAKSSDPLSIKKRRSQYDGDQYTKPPKDSQSPPAAPATDRRKEPRPKGKRSRPAQSSVSNYKDEEEHYRKYPRRSQRLFQTQNESKVSPPENQKTLSASPPRKNKRSLVPPVSKLPKSNLKFKLNRGAKAVEAAHVQAEQKRSMVGAPPPASPAKSSPKTAPKDDTKFTKAEAGRRTHLPRPPGKLVRKRRSELQALVHVGHRIGVPEREIRAAYGNNPDVSKAIRSLCLQGLMVRCGGQGKKSSPWCYRLSQGSLKHVSKWASELEADMMARSKEEIQ